MYIHTIISMYIDVNRVLKKILWGLSEWGGHGVQLGGCPLGKGCVRMGHCPTGACIVRMGMCPLGRKLSASEGKTIASDHYMDAMRMRYGKRMEENPKRDQKKET